MNEFVNMWGLQNGVTLLQAVIFHRNVQSPLAIKYKEEPYDNQKDMTFLHACILIRYHVNIPQIGFDFFTTVRSGNNDDALKS